MGLFEILDAIFNEDSEHGVTIEPTIKDGRIEIDISSTKK